MCAVFQIVGTSRFVRNYISGWFAPDHSVFVCHNVPFHLQNRSVCCIVGSGLEDTSGKVEFGGIKCTSAHGPAVWQCWLGKGYRFAVA